MRTLKVDLRERSYPIHIGADAIDDPALIVPHISGERAVIVTNTTVASLYQDRFRATLQAAGAAAVSIVIPDGENHKTWPTVNLIIDELMKHRCERRTPLIALGGGVVGDVAGFAAAIYQRGMPLIQVPTTLLAQVDSAVGGKTAINHALGKNMIGAFYQPRAVIADTQTLATLPARELSAGLAEVIKYGAIRDVAFFVWLERRIEELVGGDPEALAYAVEQSCRNKAHVVAEDEHEGGVRALLNFGHTFGHAIETGTGFGTWLHGEAVAAGMVLAARLSERLGLIDTSVVERLVSLLTRAHLPVEAPRLGSERYIELMSHDKKVAAGKLRFVLLRALGDAFVTEVPHAALDELLERPPAHV